MSMHPRVPIDNNGKLEWGCMQHLCIPVLVKERPAWGTQLITPCEQDLRVTKIVTRHTGSGSAALHKIGTILRNGEMIQS